MKRGCRQQEWWSRQKGKGKRGTNCWSVYRFPKKTRPRSMDTPSPIKQSKAGELSKRRKMGRGGEAHIPAERNMICIVRGTLNANTRLFSSVPDANVVTRRSHCERGTWRGLNRGSHGRDVSHVTKEGSCCAVIKSICEKVSAGPVGEGGFAAQQRKLKQ